MRLLMSFTRWAGLTALGRHSFIYQSLYHSIRLPLSLSVRLSLQLPAGSGSVGSSIRLTDWRLMTPTNREEAVCLRNHSSIERRTDRDTVVSLMFCMQVETHLKEWVECLCEPLYVWRYKGSTDSDTLICLFTWSQTDSTMSDQGSLWLWLFVWARSHAAEWVWDRADASLKLRMMEKIPNTWIVL